MTARLSQRLGRLMLLASLLALPAWRVAAQVLRQAGGSPVNPAASAGPGGLGGTAGGSGIGTSTMRKTVPPVLMP